MFLWSFVLASLFVLGKSLESCPESNSNTPAVNLRDTILCNYDAFARPVADHQKTVNVTFNMRLKHFTYEVETSTLSLEAWLILAWIDEHLQWKPSDYGNISLVHLHTTEIWTPDISLYNGANLGEDPGLVGYSRCVVTSKGVVKCVPPSHINALCIPNLTRYPFDKHTCTLNIGSWVHKGEELDLLVTKNAVNNRDLASNGEWKLEVANVLKNVGKYECCPKDTFPSIKIVFNIERLSGAHTASVIVPTVVTVMMTFALLWLSPLDQERLTLSYVNIVVQFLQLQNVSWMIPMKGENIPLITIFQRDSLLLAIFAHIFTMIFKSIMQKKTTSPGYISTIVNSPVGMIGKTTLFEGNANYAREGEDREEIIKPDTSVSEAWVLFGRILDRLLFMSYIVVYAVMILSFLP